MKKMLDEIESHQKEINNFRPFDGQLLPHIKAYFRVGLVYSSNALEGFSYTESETKVLLEDGLTVGGKPLRDALAVTGHAKAYDYMFGLLHQQKLTSADFLKMHGLLEGSLENGTPGEFRSISVFVTGSKYPCTAAEKVQEAMDGLETWANDERDTYHPVEFAVLLHKKMVFIHPFEDGNGRVSRLAMNAALIQCGYMPLIIPPILRSEYISCLEKAHSSDIEYMKFMYRREIETQREVLRLLRGAEIEEADTASPAP